MSTTEIIDDATNHEIEQLNNPPYCQDECSARGLRKCFGEGYKICGQYDSDTCYEWSSITLCDSEYTCSEGDTRLCSNQEGVCAGLSEICESGNWSGCNYSSIEKYNSSEKSIVLCQDNLDNDCNGKVDCEESFCKLFQFCDSPNTQDSYDGGSGGGGRSISIEDSRCVTNWSCSFGECVNGIKAKICVDLNECGTLEGRPALTNKECGTDLNTSDSEDIGGDKVDSNFRFYIIGCLKKFQLC